MFNITELDKMVGQHLDPRSLVLCVQVSKKWSKSVAPLTWNSVQVDSSPTLQPSESWCYDELPILTKYGGFVRQVGSSNDGALPLAHEQSPADLVWHFLKRCPNALLLYKITSEYLFFLLNCVVLSWRPYKDSPSYFQRHWHDRH